MPMMLFRFAIWMIYRVEDRLVIMNCDLEIISIWLAFNKLSLTLSLNISKTLEAKKRYLYLLDIDNIFLRRCANLTVLDS